MGVNAYQEAEEKPIEILEIDHAVEAEQIAALRKRRAERSAADMNRALDNVRRAAEASENIMPSLIEAARTRATVGETMCALAEVLGRVDSAVV